MIVSVVMAHRLGEPHRDRALGYCQAHYPHPIIANSPGRVFSRAGALNSGVRRAGAADVVVCCNSDIVVPMPTIDEAVTLAWESGVTVYPFTRYRELTQACTDRWLLEDDQSCLDSQYEMGEDCVGPIFLVRRDAYLEVGGMDERFVGWGFEDVAWEITSSTMLGPSRRVDGDAIHLWHPFHPNSRRGGGMQSRVFLRNQQLLRRYRRAAGSPDEVGQVRWPRPTPIRIGRR